MNVAKVDQAAREAIRIKGNELVIYKCGKNIKNGFALSSAATVSEA